MEDTATPKQAALLRYMGYQPPSTKTEASQVIQRIIDEPSDQTEWERMQMWSTARHYLHPDLYPDGLAEIKASRADAIYRANNDDRGLGCPLKRITKAKAAEIVAYLDLKMPNWDATIWGPFRTITPDAFYDLIIPAAAEMDPSLLKKGYESTAQPAQRNDRPLLPPLPPIRHDPSRFPPSRPPSQIKQAALLALVALIAAVLILWALTFVLKA